MRNESPVRWVVKSGVRADVLGRLSAGDRETDAVLDAVDASESAVYNALSALERRDLAISTDDGWRATGSGHVVAEIVSQMDDVDAVIETAYWNDHDVSPIPDSLLRDVGRLRGATVIRASDTDPYRVVREVTDRMRDAASLDVLSSIYQPDYVETMPDSQDARLLLDRSVVETASERVPEEVSDRDLDETALRIDDLSLSLVLTDSTLMLSLPTLDGGFDPEAILAAETEPARAWGRRLFDHYWDRATPAAAVFPSLDE